MLEQRNHVDELKRRLLPDDVHEMLELAERLRKSHGRDLDDEAITAVSEATGATEDAVRLALKTLPAKKGRGGLVQRLRSFFLSFDPSVRRYVAAAYLGAGSAAAMALGRAFGDPQSLFGIVALIFAVCALYNAAVSTNQRMAALAGGLYGGLTFVGYSVFALLLSLVTKIGPGAYPWVLIPCVLGGALLGWAAHCLVAVNRSRLGLSDPAAERKALLQQLVDIQDKLRSSEQSVTFVSVDIVGSTRMKSLADPLAVEFTMNEYHKYVEAVVTRHGGEIHSTAGDGVTCAFAQPMHAFAASRNIQAGLFELNTHRNRTGMPIELRVGLHTGPVVAPTGAIQSVNFAQVIDIAAHLQKACPHGCVAVSAPAADAIPGGAASVGQDRIEAEGVIAYVWRPRAQLAANATAG